MYSTSKVPKHFLYGDRFASVMHARLRNNCSNLNNDLFINHLSVQRLCICGNFIENANHYFFHCPKYNAQRIAMSKETRSFHLISLDTLLYGREHLSYDDNIAIFAAVHKYIKHSSRFWLFHFLLVLFCIRYQQWKIFVNIYVVTTKDHYLVWIYSSLKFRFVIQWMLGLQHTNSMFCRFQSW